MDRRRRWIRRWLWLGLLAATLGHAAGAFAQSAVVVSTIHPLTSIVQELGGAWLEAHTLLSPGASPHTFEPRPAHMRALSRAALILAVGEGLDDWVLELARSASRAKLLLVGPRVAEAGLGIAYDGGAHDHAEHAASQGAAASGRGGHAGAIDPHVWLDPIIVRDVIAPAIAEALADVLPARAGEIAQNLSILQDELTKLDEWIADRLSSPPYKPFISYHSAWRYFARRYGLHEVAVVADFPGQEPSARGVADVVRAAREHGVSVIFAEPQLSPKAAETIAREIRGRVLFLDPIGGVPGKERYVDLMRQNAATLAEAFAAGR